CSIHHYLMGYAPPLSIPGVFARTLSRVDR
ncbi:MAG: hypothetical protein AVDCRST_MAG26-4725, partial [uncultured Chloroflexia bacterium]